MASSCLSTLSPNHSLLSSQTKHSAIHTPMSTSATWVPFPSTRRVGGRLHSAVRAESVTSVTEKLGIKIERNPPESKLTQLGVRQWPKGLVEEDQYTNLSQSTGKPHQGSRTWIQVWKEAVEIIFGCMDLDLALRMEKFIYTPENPDELKLRNVNALTEFA